MADDAVIEPILNSIAGIESKGKYDAVGPATKGDRPYGKYQVMGRNIPAWSKEALGTELPPEAFLKNPDLQEAVVRHRVGKLYDQYGNPEDVASVWHSGKPLAEAGGRKDVLGTKTTDYAARVGNEVGQTGTAQAAEMPQVDPAATLVALPDGRQVNLGVNPSAETIDAFKAKIKTLYPQYNNFNTTLAPQDEEAFQQWKQQNAPQDSGEDYDLRGAFKAGVTRDPATGHMPDTFKKPNHPTFSDQSQYAQFAPDRAGKWEGEKYIPPQGTVGTQAEDINTKLGFQPGDHLGKYVAAVTKPAGDAMKAFYHAVSGITDPNVDLKGRVQQALGLLAPLGAIPEAAGNIAWQAATDAGASPNVAAAIGTGVNIAAGFALPIPGVGRGAALAEEGLSTAARGAEEAIAAARAARGVAREAAANVSKAGASAETVAAAQAARQTAKEAAEAAATASASPETAAMAQAARQTAQEASAKLTPGVEAGQTAKAALQPVEREAAGGALKASTEEGAKAAKAEVQTGYREISDAAQDFAFEPTGAKGEQLHADIVNLREHFGAKYIDPKEPGEVGHWEGGLITGQPKQILDEMEAALQTGEAIPYSQLERFKRMVDTVTKPRPSIAAGPKETRLTQFRWDLRQLMRDTLEENDPSLAKKFDELNTRWDQEVLPAQKFTRTLAKHDDVVAFKKVFGGGKTPETAANARRALQLATDKETLKRGFYGHMLEKATEGESTSLPKLLKHYDALDPGFKDVMMSKEAKSFFEGIREQIGAAKRGEEWASAAEDVLGAETTAAKETAKEAAARGKTWAGAAKSAVGEEAAAAKEAARTQAQRGAEWAGAAKEHAREAVKTAAEIAQDKGVPKWARIVGRALHLGIGGGRGHGGIGLIISPESLINALANPKTANLLSRAVRTPINSQAVPALLNSIRNAGISTEYADEQTIPGYLTKQAGELTGLRRKGNE